MIREQETINQINNSLFDAGQIEKRANAEWRLGVNASTIENFDSEQARRYKDLLAPCSAKIERFSPLPNNIDAVIGGLCSVFTGDLPLIQKQGGTIVSQIRMDQAVEAVGNVDGKDSLIVVEDSLFTDLTSISLSDFEAQTELAVRVIKRWFEISTDNPGDLIVVKTSTPAVEQGLQELVSFMANDVLRNPDFEDIQSAPILLMYTSFWAELLNALGYLPSSRVACVEPVVHFVDDRMFPDVRLENAYYDFLEWLKDNPNGICGSRNEAFGVAGFRESVSGCQNKGRTRINPYWEVPNTRNYKEWCMKLERQKVLFPFPLRNSLLFAEAVNWGLWNSGVVQNLSALCRLEDEYYKQRKGTPKSERSKEWSEQLKASFQGRAQIYLNDLSAEVTKIISFVLGGR